MHSVSRHFDSRVACSFRLSPPCPLPGLHLVLVPY
jgi:hypothetical protein